MTFDSRRRPGQVAAFLFLLLAMLFSVAVHFRNPVLPDDDAYITYRYAANLTNGQGPVYNPGQKVFGSSSPLYVAWLVGLHAIDRSAPIPELAVRANFIFYTLTCLGVFFLLLSLVGTPALAALLAALFTLNTALLKSSVGGMETFFFAGLLTWICWALSVQRFTLASWLAGVSVLVRPEGILLVVAVFAYLLLEHRNLRRSLIGLLLPTFVWINFALPYYGTPVYESILAKSRPLYPLPSGAALVIILNELARWTTGVRTFRVIGAVLVSAPLIAALLAATGFGYYLHARSLKKTKAESTKDEMTKDKGRFYALLSAPALLVLFIVFYAITNPLPFSWYFPPMECLWFVTFTTGTVLTAHWLKQRTTSPLTAHYSLLTALVLLLAVAGSSPYIRRIADGQPATDLELRSSPFLTRTTAYRATAEWLNTAVPAGDTVLSSEVGSLGYYYRGYVIDACGLISPEALPFLPVPASERTGPASGAISLELLQSLQCDVVVTIKAFAVRSLYGSEWFRERYDLVRQFALPQPDSSQDETTVDVFFRRGGRAEGLRSSPAS